jgi:hypothetical protein
MLVINFPLKTNSYINISIDVQNRSNRIVATPSFQHTLEPLARANPQDQIACCCLWTNNRTDNRIQLPAGTFQALARDLSDAEERRSKASIARMAYEA